MSSPTTTRLPALVARLAGSDQRSLAYLVPLALLMLTWAWTAPLWSGPDEAAHYVKALGTVSSNPLGEAASWQEPEAPQTPAQHAYFADTSRRFPVDRTLAPRVPTVPCFAFHPDGDASCASAEDHGAMQDVAYVGTYPPLPYVLPGLAAHLAHSPGAGLRLARMAGTLEILALIGTALAVSGPRRSPPVGVLLGLPPMTVSLGGTLSSSGFEAAAAVALMACLVRILDGPPGRRVLVATAVAGTCLAWSRPVGPLWIACAGVLAAILGGRPAARQLAADRGARWCGAAIGATTIGALVWDAGLGFGSGVGRTGIHRSVHLFGTTAETLFRQQIGVFGFLDTVMPGWIYGTCEVLAALLLAGALWLGSGHQRAAVLASIGLFVVVDLMFIVTTTNTGFAMQGRYFLALWAFGAVLIGEVARSRWASGGPVLRWTVAGGLVLLAGLQVAGLAWAARRYAIGADRPWHLIGEVGWQPPGGWVLWAAVVAVAAVWAAAAPTLAALRGSGRDLTATP